MTHSTNRGRFPQYKSEVDLDGIAALSRQLHVPVPVDGEEFLAGRTVRRLRAEIRVRFGFREATVADADTLIEWLRDHAASETGGEIEAMVQRLELRCRELAIEPPTAERVERIVRAALRAHEERFHTDVYGRLSRVVRERLDKLLGPAKGEGDRSVAEDIPGSASAVLLKLRGNPGRPSLASMQEELAKLDLIRCMDLPTDLFDHASPRDLERCWRRVAVEAPHELRRHPDPARITWLAAFIYLRARSLTDDLVELLIETIHHIGARAERKVERKEIWVVGANRYRNPDDDLPTDFETSRDEYYKALNLPLDADRFITELQAEMREALSTFDGGLKKNRYVHIGPKGGGWITLTPLDAQPDPPNLTAFKAELNATWPMTSLLDMIKETDLRLGFTDVLRSPTT